MVHAVNLGIVPKPTRFFITFGANYHALKYEKHLLVFAKFLDIHLDGIF
jgi:hypothetical protein